jgi:prevent-host-death family protein
VKGEIAMLQITATDFKSNLGKYLSLVKREEIHITKNGEDIAILVAPKPKTSWVDAIIGIVPDDGSDIKQLKADRLAAKYESVD